MAQLDKQVSIMSLARRFCRALHTTTISITSVQFNWFWLTLNIFVFCLLRSFPSKIYRFYSNFILQLLLALAKLVSNNNVVLESLSLFLFVLWYLAICFFFFSFFETISATTKYCFRSANVCMFSNTFHIQSIQYWWFLWLQWKCGISIWVFFLFISFAKWLQSQKPNSSKKVCWWKEMKAHSSWMNFIYICIPQEVSMASHAAMLVGHCPWGAR